MAPAVDVARRSASARVPMLAVALVALVSSGCVDNPGVRPPERQLNFPEPIALSSAQGDQAPRFLYVANTNFDLRFNAGSLQSYDLQALDACMGCDGDGQCEGCTAQNDCTIVPTGTPEQSSEALTPEPCPDLLSAEVLIGSFAADLEKGPAGDRLYVPIRSKVNLTVVETNDRGQLRCGGEFGQHHSCTGEYKRGNEVVANDRNLDLPVDPRAVHVGELQTLGLEGPGDFALVAHQGGEASLFFDLPSGDSRLPSLVDVVSGLPPGLSDVRIERETQLGWLPSRQQARIGQVGIAVDPETPRRSVLFNAGSLAVQGLSTGNSADLRDIAFDPRPEVRRAYVLGRNPEALFVVDLAETEPGRLAVDRVLDVCVGPSKLHVEPISAGNGKSHLVGFVSCFDSRNLYILDLDLGALLGVVREMNGPFDIEVDRARGRIYVSDFTSSVLRVFDLGRLQRCVSDLGDGGVEDVMDPAECSPRLIATVGVPRPVSELR